MYDLEQSGFLKEEDGDELVNLMLDRQETHHIIDQDRDSIIDWGKKDDVEDNIHINPHDQEEIVYTLLMDKGKNSF